jgi:hypothetical protein
MVKKGQPRSEETKQRMRDGWIRRRANNLKKKPMSQEHRENLSASIKATLAARKVEASAQLAPAVVSPEQPIDRRRRRQTTDKMHNLLGNASPSKNLQQKLEELLGSKILSTALLSHILDPQRGNESLFTWCADWGEQNGIAVEDLGKIMRPLILRNSPLKGVILGEAKRLRLVELP